MFNREQCASVNPTIKHATRRTKMSSSPAKQPTPHADPPLSQAELLLSQAELLFCDSDTEMSINQRQDAYTDEEDTYTDEQDAYIDEEDAYLDGEEAMAIADTLLDEEKDDSLSEETSNKDVLSRPDVISALQSMQIDPSIFRAKDDADWLAALLSISAASPALQAELHGFRDEIGKRWFAKSITPHDTFGNGPGWDIHDLAMEPIWGKHVSSISETLGEQFNAEDVVKPSGPLNAIGHAQWHYPTFNTSQPRFGMVMDISNPSLRLQSRKIGLPRNIRTADTFPIRHPFSKTVLYSAERVFGNAGVRLKERCVDFSYSLMTIAPIVLVLGKPNYDIYKERFHSDPSCIIEEVRINTGFFIFGSIPTIYVVRSASTGLISNIVLFIYHGSNVWYDRDLAHAAYTDLIWNTFASLTNAKVLDPALCLRICSKNPSHPLAFASSWPGSTDRLIALRSREKLADSLYRWEDIKHLFVSIRDKPFVRDAIEAADDHLGVVSIMLNHFTAMAHAKLAATGYQNLSRGRAKQKAAGHPNLAKGRATNAARGYSNLTKGRATQKVAGYPKLAMGRATSAARGHPELAKGRATNAAKGHLELKKATEQLSLIRAEQRRGKIATILRSMEVREYRLSHPNAQILEELGQEMDARRSKEVFRKCVVQWYHCQGSTRGLGVSWPEITAFQALKSNGLTDGLTGGIPFLPDGLTEGEARNLVYLAHGLIPSVGGRRPRVHESTYSLAPLSVTA